MDHSQLGVLSLKEFDINSLDGFTCGDDNLDCFLREQSKSFEASLYNSTWIVLHPEHGMVGYFSLCNSAIELQSQEHMTLNLDESKYRIKAPAILITKLGVSTTLQRKGVGKGIIKLITDLAVQSAANISARLLIVDAINNKEDFYERCGFTACMNNPKGNQTVKMYLDLLDFK